MYSCMNVILYCRQWSEAVAFYRDTLGFTPLDVRNYFL